MTLSGTNITIGKIVNQAGSTFNGDLQEKYNVFLTGWLARNEDKELHLFVAPRMGGRRFIRLNIDGFNQWAISDPEIDDQEVQLDKTLFPDVKWEDDYPTEVKIRIM